jgi:chromate reductase
MAKVLGLVGALRRGSYNGSLMRAAVELLPAGATIDVATLAGIPVFDGDVEREQGIPPAVQSLKDRIAAADGLLIATPEYNNSLPGPLKNAIDWLSRPPADIPRVFGARPVALMGATAGPGGTALSQAAWLPVLRTLGTRPWFGARLLVAGAAQVFDESGRLIDDKLRDQLQAFVAGFAEFAARERAHGF